MDFHFLTKDFFADYNIVGWMPQPEDLSFLDEWKKFNVQDYPELLVLRKGSSWKIYVTSLPTGRTDYMQRDIQMHLIITGDVKDGGRICGFLKEIYPYLQNEYNNNESPRLQKIISNFIHKDDPVTWSKQTEDDKVKHAQELESKLVGWGGGGDSEWSFDEERWYGGDKHCREDFQAACEFLLTHKGDFTGAAASLIGIGQYEIDSFIDPDRTWNLLALLVKDATPRTALPEKELSIGVDSSGTLDTEDSDSRSTTGSTTPEDNNSLWLLPKWKWLNKINESLKKLGKGGSMIIIVAALLFAFSWGISSYNKSCNKYAIAQVEQAIREKQSVDQKSFDRVCKLADKNNPDAEFVLGDYYLADDNQDLPKAEDFFNRAVEHGDKNIQEKAKNKLDKIKNIRKTSIENGAK